MAVPKFDELMNPALEALRQLGGSASIAELEEAVAKILGLSEEDLNEIHRGTRTRFNYNLAWTRTYLKWCGLLENSSRGVWALTSEGVRNKTVDPKEIVRLVQTVVYTPKKKKHIPAEEEIDRESTWKEQLLEAIQALSPEAFERLCQRLLRESGFTHVEITGRSGDGGIDGKGVMKVGGLLSFHVIFQCKRYKGTVSPSVVRDFRGAMPARADKALLITTGTFTRDARAEAQRDSAPPIDLIDGEELAERLKSLSLGLEVTTETTEIVKIKEDWFSGL